jgi:hypothetical protein
VVEVIQRADATAPMMTTPRKRTAVLILDSTAPRRRQSVAGATVAMASRRDGGLGLG